MMQTPRDSFGALAPLEGSGGLHFYRLGALEEQGRVKLDRLPYTIRILLAETLAGEDGVQITAEHLQALAAYDPTSPPELEIPFRPGRVLLQDYAGGPALVDLAALRSALARRGGDPSLVDLRVPADLVIDHSLQVDLCGRSDAAARNQELEFDRNQERYRFFRWAQGAFANLRVLPPGAGILHPLNLEYLAPLVRRQQTKRGAVVRLDTLVGTDSHTPMIGALGTLGWGVGGIEAEAALLGRPLPLALPPVVGVRLTGTLPPLANATDLVLTLTERLRRAGVVGSFVEFFGPGVAGLSLPDRATVANMAPDWGATLAFFPLDRRGLGYLELTGREPSLIALTERLHRALGLFREVDSAEPEYARVIDFDLEGVRTSLAGPRRPQDRINLGEMKRRWRLDFTAPPEKGGFGHKENQLGRRLTLKVGDREVELGQGAVVIAAIAGCTNTANPELLLTAGLLAKRAVALGLSSRPWVKTSMTPGSRAATEYLREAGLLPALEKLGFSVAGYGCATCIGNAGPLPEEIREAATELVLAGVISGNRNFEGRISPWIKAGYLASPPLVVAYALAGRIDLDLTAEPLGRDRRGRPVYLRDLWPSPAEVAELLERHPDSRAFTRATKGVEGHNERWNGLPCTGERLFPWREESTTIQEPPFLVEVGPEPAPVEPLREARVLALLGEGVTTDHISPAGAIDPESPAGRFLVNGGTPPGELNTYGARRGDHRVMARGTFANPRLRNRLAPDREGGWTTHLPSGEVLPIWEAGERYREEGTPLIILAGHRYGTGSSRDWAAKGLHLLGIKAVLARSFERIHRSNLVGMGIAPLQFREEEGWAELGLTGRERFTVHLPDPPTPGAEVEVEARGEANQEVTFTVRLCLEGAGEVERFRQGGILPEVLRDLLRRSGPEA